MMLVCHRSGLPVDSCNWGCVRCKIKGFAALSPDHEDILALCVEIRATWDEKRLRKEEGYAEKFTIPTAKKVHDHMRRKPQDDD